MKVIIAEKPDQGTKLAAPFRSKKHKGYIEILPNETFQDGALITWAVGHICELVAPEEYNSVWKKWSLDNLPIIPEQFKYKVMKAKAQQFQIIKKLLQRADVNEIIHAGDAGREGELIVRTIVQQTGTRKPMKRLWISSLTEKAVRQGFAQLRDEADTRNLYYEAYSRACADWVVGMNASRVYSLLMKQHGVNDVFSAGRVQTPTLALVVKREREIADFISEPFWEVFAEFQMDDKQYQGKWQKDDESRLNDPKMAEAIAAFCQNKPAEIKDAQTERKEFQPPYLFNLSGLQATANKAYKFPPKKTLDIAQQLYVKGYISYPRSDSSFVTEGEARTFPEILEKLGSKPEYAPFFPLPIHSVLTNKRYVNEKKVTDHYAIIPTEQVPALDKLSDDERKIYDLIVRRLLAAHYESAVFDYTTVLTLVDSRAEFLSKGRQQIREGWRKVLFGEGEKDGEEPLLPPLVQGEKGAVARIAVKESKTQPPKRYTEGQLITLMKTAGKHLEDQELEKVLAKTEGLGTEATRAGIITMLKDRRYLEVKKNQVYATPKGMLLIAAIGEKILASPEMTARWEQRLSEIGRGQASATDFMEQAKKLAVKIIQDAVEQAKGWTFDNIDMEEVKANAPSRKGKNKAPAKVGACKLCGGDVVDKGTFYGCANYSKTKCSFTFSKKILGKTISQANAKKLLKEGKTDLIKGFKKNDKVFDAYMIWDDKTGKPSFAFPERK
ncbi:DNA topoisomerase III [Aneurinibacillus aneurinilyticus]|uniref:DNA topoisomerase n=2 Tax=Aneurinibacillus aneurinilyticus TaxID=1391 RepID=A0A848CNB0_ANEAE|nr:DNA topoisomerase III [Aneurinibacillus aneurinilyticus]ERI04302.1 DNA topoisomerase [Aneurinibacillus aneurinilyticus ATCC 12856]MED0708315.1 DNA topoisomerase III [Aneurinibacillus aneurinilyticus]MED0722097.1 DNA topoisomerase III [Aneurinibacillus aneurinilyticus]MED0733379.1 DNA topoisomerase III [Aneurinibacillus aneurinilyticus]MED0741367.1 DNA topoisomerase III [Aneurinibacillus aneurinilyticus]